MARNSPASPRHPGPPDPTAPVLRLRWSLGDLNPLTLCLQNMGLHENRLVFYSPTFKGLPVGVLGSPGSLLYFAAVLLPGDAVTRATLSGSTTAIVDGAIKVTIG
jgi:hypothetical protein